MRCRLLLVVAIVAASLPPRAEAKKPSQAPSELRKNATHLIVGKVIAIFGRIENEGDWKYIRYVAEIQVSVCEKGNRIDSGDLLYARYWQRQWIGQGQQPPDTSGHVGIPRAQDAVRVYLSRNADDGFSNDTTTAALTSWVLTATKGLSSIPAAKHCHSNELRVFIEGLAG